MFDSPDDVAELKAERDAARDRRHDLRVEALESSIRALQDELAALKCRGRDDG